jgi:argonaute-like protein implicated in RNA metabolism and viral defense
MQGQNTCNICQKQFNSEQELREHQRTAHPTGKKEQGEPSGQQQPPRREDKIAS